VTFAFVTAVADVFPVDIAIAGLQFADKSSFGYLAGTPQPVFTYIIRQDGKQQGIFPETPERVAPLYQVGSQERISTARTMLNSGAPVDTSVLKSDGSILLLHNVISLRYDFYGGWRNVKILASGECRKISVVLVHRVNDM